MPNSTFNLQTVIHTIPILLSYFIPVLNNSVPKLFFTWLSNAMKYSWNEFQVIIKPSFWMCTGHSHDVMDVMWTSKVSSNQGLHDIFGGNTRNSHDNLCAIAKATWYKVLNLNVLSVQNLNWTLKSNEFSKIYASPAVSINSHWHTFLITKGKV